MNILFELNYTVSFNKTYVYTFTKLSQFRGHELLGSFNKNTQIYDIRRY